MAKLARNWPRYARALDMHLAGHKLREIGEAFGVSRERARQIVFEAKKQLAYRVFKGLKRPLRPPPDAPRYRTESQD